MKINIITLILVIYSVWGSVHMSAVNLVNPGRTWWYWSQTAWSQGAEEVIIGLTLGEEDLLSNGWIPCYAVDSIKQRIVDVPIAHLMEQNGVVRLRPNLGLANYATKPSNELSILSEFLGYWNGNELAAVKYNYPEYDCIWNYDSITEFTLYDFNKEIGDLYSWPWSGKNLDLPIKNKHAGDLRIANIEDKYIPTDYDKERLAKVYYLQQDINYESKTTFNANIIDGIGIVNGEFLSYIEDFITWYGFFIAPQSISGADLAGSFYSSVIPILYSVEDSDGSSLYIAPDYYVGAGIDISAATMNLNDVNIYDLHGRAVTNPVPGSIYIRNGKKFVAE